MPKDAFSFNILDSIDSTNNYAMEKVHAGLARHGTGYFAHHQTKGKGQRGKTWQTGEGKNIALSILIKPKPAKPLQQFHLSVTVALACFDLFKKYAGDETKIKWPNDLYWRDRKAGGVLIENIFRGKEWRWAIVGIGININEDAFSKQLENAISLKQITNMNFDVIQLAKELQQLVIKRTDKINSGSLKKSLEEYNTHLFKLDEEVKLRYQNKTIKTVINGVNENGQLIGTDQLFDFGEVEWIL